MCLESYCYIYIEICAIKYLLYSYFFFTLSLKVVLALLAIPENGELQESVLQLSILQL